MNEFVFDSEKLSPGTDLKNIIKVPVVFCAEMVKFYSETGKYMFMPYPEIKDAIAWHKEHLPRLPITIEHIPLFDADKKIYIPNDSEIIGYVSQLSADDKHKNGRGWAYITRSKIHSQLADSLIRGHQIGVSVGGFAGGAGPPGFYDGEKYDASHMKLKFHHVALIIMSIPRCPTGVCGFNVVDSESLIEYVNKEMPIFIANGMEQEQAVAMSISSYKKQTSYKDSFDISAEKPTVDFKDFHESLILNDLLSPKSCVHDFYKHYQDAIRDLDSDVINNNEEQIEDINLLSNQKKEANILSEEQLKLLNEQIKSLKTENDELKDSKFADAEKTVTDLQEANKEFADANTKLQEDLAKLQTDLMTYKQEEIFKMQKTILDSKAYKPEEIKAMDYNALKSTYDVVKRFSDSAPGQVLRPKPATNFSTLPRPAPDAIEDSQPAIAPRQYRLGTPPPMDVILDEKNDHWKSRYGEKPKGGNF